jgi:hypothetical protein
MTVIQKVAGSGSEPAPYFFAVVGFVDAQEENPEKHRK